MAPKKKEQEVFNPMVQPPLDLDHIPLVDMDFKIHETLSEFDLFDIYCWWEDKFVEEMVDIGLYDINLPFYIFPKTHSCPELIRKCHSCYNLQKRVVMAPTGHIFFTIDAKSLMQMMQALVIEGTTPFSHEILTEMYQELDFSKRAKTLEIFMIEHTPLPHNNPPYSSSVFPNRTRHIVTILSYLVGYYSDQCLDEVIIAFLSILSTKSKPSILFNFSQFLADSIHE